MHSTSLDQRSFSIGLFPYLEYLKLKKNQPKNQQIFAQKKHCLLTIQNILEDSSCSVTFQHHAQNSGFRHLISAKFLPIILKNKY